MAMTTVTWAQDSNGRYEVSSAQHLKQLMHRGALYTDAGSFPADYWAAGTSYIQTADIDLLGNSSDTKPIGVNSDRFNGIYDGAEFSISNWSYVDPAFGAADASENIVGLFGECRDATLKNIRLDGVWTLQGYSYHAGFLVGYFNDVSSTETRGIFNVEGDFSRGTFIENDASTNTTSLGCMIGYAVCPIVEGLTIRGIIDLRGEILSRIYNRFVGGIVGYINVKTRATLLRNLATFPSGLAGENVGGVMGQYAPYGGTLSRCLNAMTGNISGSVTAGGVIGTASCNASGETIDGLVNAMYGDIVYTSSRTNPRWATGGVIGSIYSVDSVSRALNYMTGELISITTSVGGLIGYCNDTLGAELNDSLNAMNGNTKGAIIGVQANSNLVVSRVQANTNYGLAFTNTDTFSTADAPTTGLLTNPTFADLPYFNIDGTDALGNTYDFGFVYANISGSSSYTDTHVIISNGTNNFENRTPRLTIEPSTTSISALIYEDPSETIVGHNITVETATGGEVTVVSGVTTLAHDVTGLPNSTECIVRLYTDSGAGAGYTLTSYLETKTLPPFITWVRDANGRYEVSSAAHLKQLMNNGTLYTDDGSAPTNLYNGNVSYIQTTDIDFLGDSTDIHPIGSGSGSFNSDYDGGGFKILNWSYVDLGFPYNGGYSEEFHVGLFGVSRNNRIANIRLGGVWTLQGYGYSAGFLVATQANQVGDGLGIMNIECDFSPGTLMENNKDGTTTRGGVIGLASSTTVQGITLRGTIDFAGTFTDQLVGGVIGRFSGNSGVTDIETVSLVQNLARFPSGIRASGWAGGVIGSVSTCNMTSIMNAMTGDIVSVTSGGVVGTASGVRDLYYHRNLVNSMTGDIIGANYSGGVIGAYSTRFRMDRFFNYMSGDIISTTGSSGGLFGFYSDIFAELGSCLNAMNGNVGNSLIGEREQSRGTITRVTINTSYGLTYTDKFYSTSGSPNGSIPLSELPGLRYFNLVGTDSLGNAYDFDFVFANLGGNASYSTTHLLVVDGQAVFQNGVVPPLEATPRATGIRITFTEVQAATGYKVTLEGPTGGEVTALSDIDASELEHRLTGLDPETTYIIRLYADVGSGFSLREELTTATLANTAPNYDIADFRDRKGRIDLKTLDTKGLSYVSDVMNDLFDTGDVVSVSVKGRPGLNTSFVRLGETLRIQEVSGVLLPFTEGSVSGQDVSVILSDGSTTVDIDYDEEADGITVNGAVYYPGDTFVLDGKKVTVLGY